MAGQDCDCNIGINNDYERLTNAIYKDRICHRVQAHQLLLSLGLHTSLAAFKRTAPAAQPAP